MPELLIRLIQHFQFYNQEHWYQVLAYKKFIKQLGRERSKDCGYILRHSRNIRPRAAKLGLHLQLECEQNSSLIFDWTM